MAILSGFSKYSNVGLLLMRIGIGAMMIVHGYPKLIGGPEKWEKIGGAMANLGMNAYPTFWGFMAAATESFGGLLLILGLAFRPACLLLVFTMVVAALSHFYRGDELKGASHAIELGFAFLGMLFVGPGKYSVDKG
ncbi:MAG TPA: DoxX family protein [Flavipsychrobacter sp.]|nr:DoxX family protein [Flavipsychrobacter sp.]